LSAPDMASTYHILPKNDFYKAEMPLPILQQR